MQGPEQPSQVSTPCSPPSPVSPGAGTHATDIERGGVPAPQLTGQLAPPAGHQWRASAKALGMLHEAVQDVQAGGPESQRYREYIDAFREAAAFWKRFQLAA
jgi:hypothetical protein